MLKNNTGDVLAYNTLKEVLINRRRLKEVAHLKVQTYQSVNLQVQHNEFHASYADKTEKILLSSFCRIVKEKHACTALAGNAATFSYSLWDIHRNPTSIFIECLTIRTRQQKLSN